MKKMKYSVILLLSICAQQSHAGLLDWLEDRNLEVHRLAAGEVRTIRGVTVACIGGLRLQDPMQEGIYYMNALGYAVRDRIPGVSLYCGVPSDYYKHQEKRRNEERRNRTACIVKVEPRTSKQAGNTGVLYFDRSTKKYSGGQSFGEGNVKRANLACMDFQDRNMCTCYPYDENSDPLSKSQIFVDESDL